MFLSLPVASYSAFTRFQGVTPALNPSAKKNHKAHDSFARSTPQQTMFKGQTTSRAIDYGGLGGTQYQHSVIAEGDFLKIYEILNKNLQITDMISKSKNFKGENALMVAIDNNHKDVVRMMVGYFGFDPLETDDAGKSALDHIPSRDKAFRDEIEKLHQSYKDARITTEREVFQNLMRPKLLSLQS